mgnify:FL=1
MKVGDLVRLKNLHSDWGKFALVTHINVTSYGLGQISIIANGRMSAIPWIKRGHYIEEKIC